MSLNDLLNHWRDTPTIAPNIAAWHTRPAQPAQTASLPTNLHPTLAHILHELGIHQLYTHQAAAWTHLQAGRRPVIVTGTASGKTLCYNLPVLDHLLNDPHARALYLFPTKALTHDQAAALNKLSAISRQPSAVDGQGSSFINHQSSFPPASTYDGDTPTAARPAIRRQARIVLSNPDMLHTAILPHHTKWADFFRNLRFVVIDEMHVYRGVFGSHVANVLRRLKRITAFYGAEPQFILTSATIANPTELAERLIEAPTVLVDNDGSAKGPKHFLIYNPPIIDADLGLRRSSLLEGVRLAQDLFHHNLQTILFARTRRTVELLLTYLKDTILTSPPPPTTQPSSSPSPNPPFSILNSQFSILNSPIRAYRSGYLPRQRREIEQELRSGDVKTIVATSALELGIDIGQLSAAVLVGYPGTIAGTWQQAGRAGRQEEPALAVLITSANPLDQFLAHHPDYFFERTPEQALIDPDNLLILLQHLRCAAFELPFRTNEPFGRVEPAVLAEFLQYLYDSGELHRSNDQYFWMDEHYPAQLVSLRTASPSKVTLQAGDENDAWATIGEVDVASADWMVHPEAIYLHEGQSFRVETLDLEQQVARLRPVNVDYYTEPLRETTVQLIDQIDHAAVTGATKNHGEILVTTQIIGYRMLSWFSHERLGEGEVELPPNELQTSGYWLTL
ncbi:MAG: DEAD/DEAH box helicase, partial [Anaerolineae bacterium]|nr:DEAD/DEAH box helicase [Anaerolineae bacterium]